MLSGLVVRPERSDVPRSKSCACAQRSGCADDDGTPTQTRYLCDLPRHGKRINSRNTTGVVSVQHFRLSIGQCRALVLELEHYKEMSVSCETTRSSANRRTTSARTRLRSKHNLRQRLALQILIRRIMLLERLDEGFDLLLIHE